MTTKTRITAAVFALLALTVVVYVAFVPEAARPAKVIAVAVMGLAIGTAAGKA
jgi:hypothetical protein